MSYKSPIEFFQTDPFFEHVRDEMDNMIYRAVVHADVNVDREELIKALEYDRGQYEKGYADGLAYKPPVTTKADRIRSMTDEELADLLCDHACSCCPIVVCKGRIEVGRKACRKRWLDWLREEAET